MGLSKLMFQNRRKKEEVADSSLNNGACPVMGNKEGLNATQNSVTQPVDNTVNDLWAHSNRETLATNSSQSRKVQNDVGRILEKHQRVMRTQMFTKFGEV